ncbi:MAG TPA: monovalent cation/H(+) antiporter subunit G [Steroidobacteraceae bacterium]|jgi:multicomponent K+:H+ antiporter subunit G
MNGEALPLWASVPAAVLLVMGGVSAVLGSLGLLRLPSFYARMHGPSMGSTLGLGCVLLASMLLATVLSGRAVMHEILITVFVVTTSPITAMLLMRAAVSRPKDEPPPG